MIAPETRANILIEALPYIKEYNGEVIVVKYGGNRSEERRVGKECRL